MKYVTVCILVGLAIVGFLLYYGLNNSMPVKYAYYKKGKITPEEYLGFCDGQIASNRHWAKFEKRSNIQFYKALAYTRAEDYVNAAIEARSAILSYSGNAEAHFLLIIIRLREHKGEEAIAALDYIRILAEGKGGGTALEKQLDLMESAILKEIDSGYTTDLDTLLTLFFGYKPY